MKCDIFNFWQHAEVEPEQQMRVIIRQKFTLRQAKVLLHICMSSKQEFFYTFVCMSFTFMNFTGVTKTVTIRRKKGSTKWDYLSFSACALYTVIPKWKIVHQPFSVGSIHLKDAFTLSRWLFFCSFLICGVDQGTYQLHPFGILALLLPLHYHDTSYEPKIKQDVFWTFYFWWMSHKSLKLTSAQVQKHERGGGVDIKTASTLFLCSSWNERTTWNMGYIKGLSFKFPFHLVWH